MLRQRKANLRGAHRDRSRRFRASLEFPAFGHPGLRLHDTQLQGHGQHLVQHLEPLFVGRYEPVPQESMSPILSLYCGCAAMCLNIPSAIVDRQMLPKHTKRTATGWSGK